MLANQIVRVALVTTHLPLRAAAANGARIVSICTGAFALAAAGLLDGRRATPHWRHAGLLQYRFPRVHVTPSELYIQDGPVLTGAGSAAGLDLCLHLIRSDHGAGTANEVARRLVEDRQRRVPVEVGRREQVLHRVLSGSGRRRNTASVPSISVSRTGLPSNS